MADASSELAIWVKLKDDASKGLEGIQSSVKAMEPAFKSMMVVGTAALGAVAGIAYKAVNDFMEVEAAQKALEHATIDVSHATRDQLQAVKDMIAVTEQKGVVDGDALTVGVAQLSTFGLTTNMVKQLTPALADLAVNQYGVNVSGEQMGQTANMVAKVLNGQFGVLEKSGIRFTDVQQKMIQFGTEQEKIAAITEGLNQNLKFTNDVALTTMAGKLAVLHREMGNISEAIGAALFPALQSILSEITPIATAIANWAANNPQLVTSILALVAGMGGLLLAVGGIGLALPSVIAGVEGLSAALVVLFTTATGGVFLALLAIGTAFVTLYTQSEGFRNAINSLAGVLGGVLMGILQGMGTMLQGVFTWLGQVATATGAWFAQAQQSIFFKSVIDALTTSWGWLHTVITASLIPAFQALWGVIKDDLWPQVQNLWIALQPFMPMFKLLGEVILGIVVVAIVAFVAALSGALILVAKVMEAIAGFAEILVGAVARNIQSLTTNIQKLVDTFKSLFDWVQKTLNKLSEFGSSGASLNPFSSSFKLPFIGKAGGGPVYAGQSYIVGERGPETITMGGNGQVTPIGQGGGGMAIYIQNYIGTQEFTRQIGNELSNILKMNKRV